MVSFEKVSNVSEEIIKVLKESDVNFFEADLVLKRVVDKLEEGISCLSVNVLSEYDIDKKES